MAETSFTGPKFLKHLFLTQTGISNLEFIPVHNLENLESLHLGSNHISSINLPENFPTQNLKVLDFQNNAIHYISRKDTNSLEQATNLSLNFNGNDIKGIEPGAFNSKIFQSVKFGGSLDLYIIFKGLQNSTIQSLWLGTFEGVGCHFLLQCMKVKSEREVAQSCLTPCDPMDCSPPGSSVHGIFQARVLEWGAITFSNA